MPMHSPWSKDYPGQMMFLFFLFIKTFELSKGKVNVRQILIKQQFSSPWHTTFKISINQSEHKYLPDKDWFKSWLSISSSAPVFPISYKQVLRYSILSGYICEKYIKFYHMEPNYYKQVPKESSLNCLIVYRMADEPNPYRHVPEEPSLHCVVMYLTGKPTCLEPNNYRPAAKESSMLC